MTCFKSVIMRQNSPLLMLDSRSLKKYPLPSSSARDLLILKAPMKADPVNNGREMSTSVHQQQHHSPQQQLDTATRQIEVRRGEPAPELLSIQPPKGSVSEIYNYRLNHGPVNWPVDHRSWLRDQDNRSALNCQVTSTPPTRKLLKLARLSEGPNGRPCCSNDSKFLTSCQQDREKFKRAGEEEEVPIKSSRKHKNYSITSQQESQQQGKKDKHQQHHSAIKLISNLMSVVKSAAAGCSAKQRRAAPTRRGSLVWPQASGLVWLVLSVQFMLLLLSPATFKLAAAIAASASSSSSSGATSVGQQYFEVQPEAEYLIQNGHDARLRCLIRSRQGECLWLRNGRAIGMIQKKYQFTRQPEDGDCSLMIRNVSVQQDDGLWQCQVTAPDVEQDTLQSREVRLIVLVSPERPQIKNTSQNTHRLIMEENKTKFVVCEIRGGNPAPQIEWLLDNKNITKEAQSSSFFAPQQQQANNQAGGQRISQSKLRMSDIKRNMNGKNLTCVGVHQTLNQSASVELDVQYVPTVSVVQREYSIVEGSPLSISCQVDANPPPNLVNWRLVSDGPPTVAARNPAPSSIAQPTRPGPVLEFERISRDLNQNIFECLAQNSYGISLPADVKLNVLYAPFLLNTSHSESVMVGSEAQLACIFDGNPEPEVKWHYTDPLSRSALPVQLDNNKQQYLTIKNVTYRNEGDYHCEARNQINGVFYGVRSSNILLDVYGEPQFLVKAPVHSKAVQGTKSDLTLAFCSDPPPNKVYWQFGSLRLDVRSNNINNGQQPTPGGPLAPAGGNSKQSAVSQRFQVHPLQTLQKRDSTFSKTPTCFEAQLSILDPELTDQRDYTLVVQNDRGHSQSIVRLRVSSPLSPVLMITSAFVTICGLFLCSLIIMFLVKKRHGSGNTVNGHHSSQNGNGDGPVIREKGVGGGVEHLINGNGNAAAAAAALASAAAVNAQLMQQQTRGIVNGLGNGVANGAGNPTAQSPKTNGGGERMHLMSMAASDTSGDQKQLLANLDRNSSASGSSNHGCVDYDASSPGHTMATNSTPSPMNHISVDDETTLNAGSTYQAGEPVQLDAQQLGQGLIYANLDYTDHHHSVGLSSVPDNTTSLAGDPPTESQHCEENNNTNSVPNHHHSGHLQQHQQRQSALQRRQQTPMEHSPTGSSLTDQSMSSILASSGANNQQAQTQRRPGSPPGGIRSSVGATIAMMNSLAAAANQNAGSSPNSGGALSHQLANSRQLRKPGPPKPPKPSIQQRNRFYQQQHGAINNSASNTGLVMIGQATGGYSNPMGPMDSNEPSANELAVEYSRIAFPARAEL